MDRSGTRRSKPRWIGRVRGWARLGSGVAPDGAPARSFHAGLLAAFLVLAGGIGISGLLHLRGQVAHSRADAEATLSAIADLKVQQIADWRGERLHDARFYADVRFAARDIQAYLSEPPATADSGEVLHRLSVLREEYKYRRVALYDPQLNLRLSVPPRYGDPDMRQAAADALKSRGPVMSDLHLDPRGTASVIDLAFPVLLPDTGPVLRDAAPIAVLALQIDAGRYLYPLVQSWPTPSRTAETLLVRRDGDSVLFLNELRHRGGTALKLRLPLSSAGLPAAMAVQGRIGIVEGVDYRGVPVIAAVRAVPGTPWFMVAKVDRDEIFARLRQRATLSGALVLVLLLAVSLGVGLLLRRHDAELLRRQLDTERERKAVSERLAAVTRNANDIILLADEQARIVEANERAVEAYGYPLAELLNLGMKDLRAPETLSSFADDQALIEAQGGARFETMHRRKDGSCFPVEVSARVVHFGGAHKLSVVRDITERRAHEREIKRLNRLYAILSQVNQAIVRCDAPEELLGAVCRVAVEFGHFRAAWIGRRQEDGTQTCLALHGGVVEEGDTWPAVPCAMAEEALRTGCPAVAADAGSDARTVRCRHSLHSCGLCACAALPISLNGRPWGVFAVCSPEAGLFSPDEIRVLEELTEDIAFALDHFDQAARRRAAEEETHFALAKVEAANQQLQAQQEELQAANEELQAQQEELQASNEELQSQQEELQAANEELWAQAEELETQAQELARAYAVHRAVARSIPDGAIWVVDQDGRFLAADGPLLDRLGVPREGLTARDMGDTLGFPATRHLADGFRCALAGEVVHWEGELQGRFIWVQHAPLRDEDGHLLGAMALALDISGKKHAEDALRRSEDLFRKIFQQHAAVKLLLDPETGAILDANAAAAAFYGWPVEQLLQMRIHDINTLPPDGVTAALRQVIDRERVHFELRHRRADGSVRDVEAFSSKIVADGRDLVHTIVIDVTARKQAEDALRESEERYRGLFEHLVQGFAHCRMLFEDGKPKDFVYLAVNEAFEALTGLHGVVGKRVTEVIPGIQESDPELFEAYGRVALTEEPETFEIFVAALQEWFTVSAYSPIPGHFVAIFDEITERKEAEQRLMSALEEKSVLLREVHHRVKNNLQVMIHLLRRRRDQTRDAEARGFLTQLEDQARSMSLVYEQLFQTESIARVEMGAYLGGIVEGLRQTFPGERTVALTVAAGGVVLDAEQAMPCGLIVNELVTNALKHAFPPEFQGTPEIRVSLTEDDKIITLRVSDSGVGGPALRDWRTAPTQGMRLVELWATHQLGGTFALDAQRGTTVTVTYDRRANEG